MKCNKCDIKAMKQWNDGDFYSIKFVPIQKVIFNWGLVLLIELTIPNLHAPHRNLLQLT